MLTAIGTISPILSVVLLYCYMTYKSEKKYSFKDFFTLRWDKKCFTLLICALAVGEALFCYQHFANNDASFLTALRDSQVLIWLIAIAYIDLKQRIIPNKLVVCGAVFWLAIALMEIFIGKTPAKSLVLFSLAGALVCGGVLLIVALLVKTALGMGDVKLFAVMGLLYGLYDTYSVLLYSVIIMAIVSIILLIAKKVTRKTAVPMAPFAALGFLINVLV